MWQIIFFHPTRLCLQFLSTDALLFMQFSSSHQLGRELFTSASCSGYGSHTKVKILNDLDQIPLFLESDVVTRGFASIRLLDTYTSNMCPVVPHFSSGFLFLYIRNTNSRSHFKIFDLRGTSLPAFTKVKPSLQDTLSPYLTQTGRSLY